MLKNPKYREKETVLSFRPNKDGKFPIKSYHVPKVQKMLKDGIIFNHGKQNEIRKQNNLPLNDYPSKAEMDFMIDCDFRRQYTVSLPLGVLMMSNTSQMFYEICEELLESCLNGEIGKAPYNRNENEFVQMKTSIQVSKVLKKNLTTVSRKSDARFFNEITKAIHSFADFCKNLETPTNSKIDGINDLIKISMTSIMTEIEALYEIFKGDKKEKAELPIVNNVEDASQDAPPVTRAKKR